MKTLTQKELKKILKLHEKWLNKEEGGIKADLSNINLVGANLSNTNLFKIDLSNSNLFKTNLSNANLEGSNLSNANLFNVNLEYANLYGADLSYADLSYANLSFSNLSGTNLSDTNLSGVNLLGTKTDKRYIQISCVGSRKGMTTYCFDDDVIWCGCFIGSLEEFENKVNKKHKDNSQYLKEYLGVISYIKSLK